MIPPLVALPPTPTAAVVDAPPARAPVVIFHRRSSLQDVYVVDEGGERLLRFGRADGNDQSALDPAHPDRLVFEYVRLATLGALLAPLTTATATTATTAATTTTATATALRRALVIGLGGGAYPGWLVRHDARVTVDVVELDPVVVDVARRYFGLPQTPRLAVHTRDGAAFVARARAGYDLVLLDAFSGDGIPAGLSSAAFFADARRILSDDGVVMLNIALVTRDDADAITRRFTDAFPGCVAVRGRREDNVVLFGARRPLTTALLEAAVARAPRALGLDVADDVGAVRACR